MQQFLNKNKLIFFNPKVKRIYQRNHAIRRTGQIKQTEKQIDKQAEQSFVFRKKMLQFFQNHILHLSRQRCRKNSGE